MHMSWVGAQQRVRCCGDAGREAEGSLPYQGSGGDLLVMAVPAVSASTAVCAGLAGTATSTLHAGVTGARRVMGAVAAPRVNDRSESVAGAWVGGGIIRGIVLAADESDVI